jgi:hypothetical protein
MRGFARGLLADREFLKLWSGGFVSTLGFHVSALAMQLTAAVVLGATPFEMGLLGAAQYLPRFAFGLVAGAWIDRLRRRPLLIGADAGRALLLASIPFAHVLGSLTIEQLYLVALGMGALNTFFEVAILSYVPGLVGRHRLLEANSQMQAGEAVAQIAGPNLAGILVQWLTAPIAIGVDAVSYAVSALFIGWIRRPEPMLPPSGSRAGLWPEVRDGLRVVAAHPILRALAAAGVNHGFFSGGIRGSLVVLYLVQLGVTPLEFGIIYGIGGAVALVGALVARPIAAALGLGTTLLIANLVQGAFAAIVPLAGFFPEESRLPLLIVGQLGLGIAAPVWGINGGTLQQVVAPEQALGRVTATQRFAFFGVHPVGAVVGGVLAAVIGLQLTLTIAAAGVALGALWIGLTEVGRLREMPVPAVSAALQR